MSESTPSAVSADTIRNFHADGLLGPFELCPPDEMAALHERLLAEEFTAQDPPSGWWGNARHLDSRRVYDLCAHPAILDRLEALVGPDLVLWNSGFWIKEPDGSAVPWHQDLHYWPMDPPLNFTAWVAITETTAENGALEVLPGSHLSVLPTAAAPDDVLFETMADPKAFDGEGGRLLEMRAGECILFNDRLLHRSGRNTTASDRTGLVVRYTVPMVQLFQDRLPLFPAHHTIVVRGRDRFGKNRSGPAPAADG
ncbi:MAG: phytanoyl-CoA dioxygenase family protein [Acidobacteriota bacterium]